MKITAAPLSKARQHNTRSPVEPIIMALTLFLIIFVLRYAEAFVPALDAVPGKSIVSRILGSLLVLAYLWVLRKPISSIGLHSRNFDKAFLIGGLSLLSLYAALYALQFSRLSAAGESPQLVFAAINQQTGVMGGPIFTWLYLFGQIVNAFMEESIFRGVMLPHLMRRLKFWQANLLQAFLFGLAHLAFPLSSWVRGQVTAGEAFAEATSLLIFATLGGLIFGYLYYRTDNLWTAWFAHLIDNAVGLFFHIQIASRLNAETDILIFASIGFISLAFLARVIARRTNLPTLKPWGTN